MLSTKLEIPLTEQIKALNSFCALTQGSAIFEAIYDLDAILAKTELSKVSVEYLKSQPEVAEIIQERYLADVPDLEKLLTYPKDSLGYIFADHLTANNFDPEFYRKRQVKDDISYVSLRRSQTHDIHHIVTGFGTDTASELGLQAFQLAQMRSPIAIAIMTSGIISSLSQTNELTARMQQIILGWQMGLVAKPFIAQKWEEHWEKPLDQWRSELGIVPENQNLLAG
jgi:ubiquinone biosynthesis protein COQ4